MASFLPQALLQFLARRLRFPQLFAVLAGLFLFDLLMPDFVPFIDELLLGLLTLLVGSIRSRNAEVPREDPPIKNVTPPLP